MTDQLRISDSGDIEVQPLTWDGEPLYCEDTVREGLFDVAAFSQLSGQTWMPACGRWQCIRNEDCSRDIGDEPEARYVR